jgi:hypothetical protein
MPPAQRFSSASYDDASSWHRKIRGKESAAAYSSEPEITDGEPPDVKFPRVAAAYRKTADHQPANCESGKRKKAESESARG